jgi:hypothetical protein
MITCAMPLHSSFLPAVEQHAAENGIQILATTTIPGGGQLRHVTLTAADGAGLFRLGLQVMQTITEEGADAR